MKQFWRRCHAIIPCCGVHSTRSAVISNYVPFPSFYLRRNWRKRTTKMLDWVDALDYLTKYQRATVISTPTEVNYLNLKKVRLVSCRLTSICSRVYVRLSGDIWLQVSVTDRSWRDRTLPSNQMLLISWQYFITKKNRQLLINCTVDRLPSSCARRKICLLAKICEIKKNCIFTRGVSKLLNKCTSKDLIFLTRKFTTQHFKNENVGRRAN